MSADSFWMAHGARRAGVFRLVDVSDVDAALKPRQVLNDRARTGSGGVLPEDDVSVPQDELGKGLTDRQSTGLAARRPADVDHEALEPRDPSLQVPHLVPYRRVLVEQRDLERLELVSADFVGEADDPG
ncbi:MAG: hypothetical protein N3H32_02180, partial [Nitrososphaeria archaeon]|nr:hypothetical protein [Nitrososphaeria archaeon]